MNRTNIIKMALIFCVGIICVFFLYEFLDKEFPEIFKQSENVASFVVMTLVVGSGMYGFLSANGVGVFSMRLLLWGVILLVIVVGYAFRFELTYIKQRVLAVLVPSYSWVNESGEIVIARNNDGHFYIDGIVNGVKIRFMVDTGASDVALTTSDAKKLGLDLSKLLYNRNYLTANGPSQAAAIKLATVVIGGTFENVDAHIGTGGLDISLLGMSVLGRFKSFKIDRDLLILVY